MVAREQLRRIREELTQAFLERTEVIDGALAAIRAPSGTETDVARRAIASCAPGALR